MTLYETTFMLPVGSEFSVAPFLGDTNLKRCVCLIRHILATRSDNQTPHWVTGEHELRSTVYLKRTEIVMGYFKSLSVPRLHSVEEQNE
jgi:hypothetical protein